MASRCRRRFLGRCPPDRTVASRTSSRFWGRGPLTCVDALGAAAGSGVGAHACCLPFRGCSVLGAAPTTCVDALGAATGLGVGAHTCVFPFGAARFWGRRPLTCVDAPRAATGSRVGAHACHLPLRGSCSCSVLGAAPVVRSACLATRAARARRAALECLRSSCRRPCAPAGIVPLRCVRSPTGFAHPIRRRCSLCSGPLGIARRAP